MLEFFLNSNGPRKAYALILNCIIFFLGQSVIVWKEPTRIISAGQRMIRKDSRMKLIPTPTGGMGLRIERVTPDDRGEA